MVRGSSASLSRTFVDAGVVEQDDLPLRCQRVADGGVEVVEVAHEVLGEDQRGAGRGPEAAVGETGAADVEELGGSGCGEGRDHGWLLLFGRRQADTKLPRVRWWPGRPAG